MVHSFEVKQRVIWNLNSADNWMIARYGDGPFEIITVTLVPEPRCHCGGDEDYGHDDECPKTVGTLVGHHQWVEIETLQGVRQFSGAYFLPAV